MDDYLPRKCNRSTVQFGLVSLIYMNNNIIGYLCLASPQTYSILCSAMITPTISVGNKIDTTRRRRGSSTHDDEPKAIEMFS